MQENRGHGSNFEREGDRYGKLQAVETELSCPAGGFEGFSGFIQNIEFSRVIVKTHENRE